MGDKIVARALRAEGIDVVASIEYYGAQLAQLAQDPDWIADATADGMALIMKDKRTRREPAPRARICAVGAQCFSFANGNLTGPVMAQTVVDRLELMRGYVANESGPFFYHLYENRPPRRMDLTCP